MNCMVLILLRGYSLMTSAKKLSITLPSWSTTVKIELSSLTTVDS